VTRALVMSSSGRRDGARGQKIGEEEKARRKRNRMGKNDVEVDGDEGDDDG
jgi:hypothetical protein